MKKVFSSLLCLVLVAVCLCGCGKNNDTSKIDNEKAKDTAQYTYKVSGLQGVDYCVYYGLNDEVPNSPDPEAARNKIHVWTACPNCGSDSGAYAFTIDVKDLDFLNGDTIQYSDFDTCTECERSKNIKGFMWAVSITREKINE